MCGCRVEVHVGIELAVLDHILFHPAGHFEQLGNAAGGTQAARHLAEMCGTRVFEVIDAMAESRNLFFCANIPFR